MRLLTAEQAKREISAVVEQHKKNVLSATIKAEEQIGTLTASLEQTQKEIGALKKEKDAVIHELGELREGKERAEYERDALNAKPHCAQRATLGFSEREKCAGAIPRVQSGAGELQGPVKKESADMQKPIEKHWVEVCRHLGALLAVRVVEALEHQIRQSRGVGGLYVQS